MNMSKVRCVIYWSDFPIYRLEQKSEGNTKYVSVAELTRDMLFNLQPKLLQFTNQ